MLSYRYKLSLSPIGRPGQCHVTCTQLAAGPPGGQALRGAACGRRSPRTLTRRRGARRTNKAESGFDEVEEALADTVNAAMNFIPRNYRANAEREERGTVSDDP